MKGANVAILLLGAVFAALSHNWAALMFAIAGALHAARAP